MGRRPADQLGNAPDYLAHSDVADAPHPVDRNRAVLGGHDRPAHLGCLTVRHCDRAQRALHAVDVDRARGRHPHRDCPDVRCAALVARRRVRGKALSDGRRDYCHRGASDHAAAKRLRRQGCRCAGPARRDRGLGALARRNACRTRTMDRRRAGRVSARLFSLSPLAGRGERCGQMPGRASHSARKIAAGPGERRVKPITEFLHGVETTPLAIFVSQSTYGFAAIDMFHIASVSVVFGMIAILDLRLTGMAFSDFAVTDLSRQVLPWTWVAFGIAAITGGLMFTGQAGKYSVNFPFLVKIALMALAGLNM